VKALSVRQDANRERLVGVAEDRVHTMMESVTRHDRIVGSANAQGERLQHSDLKAQLAMVPRYYYRQLSTYAERAPSSNVEEYPLS
jgi:hypothetical protein